jgi:TrmH family RNA methyltransferase
MAQPPKQVTSSKNPIVQRFRDAAAGDAPGLILAEGTRLVGEGLDAGVKAAVVAVSPRLRDDALRARLQAGAVEFVECADEVLARISALETHQGVAVLFEQRQWQAEELLRGSLVPLVVAAAGVRDPGNLGALLRTAEAAGATGFLCLQGGADPFRDKAVRGSMGSVFRLPVLARQSPADVIAFARAHKLQLAAADSAGGTEYLDADLRRPLLLVVGAEAEGMPPELLRAADLRLRIGLASRVESLNVAVAAGVLLFEVRRQRR